MRSIDYRRHSMRDPGGVHLNAAGRELARRVAAGDGPFARAVSSPLPRAVETARTIAGRPVETRAELATVGASAERAIGPIAQWSDFARAVRASPAVAKFAAEQAKLLREIAAALPDGGRALVVSHSGVLELGAVGALPDARHEAWGPTAGYCEGIRLIFEEGRFVEGTPLRVG